MNNFKRILDLIRRTGDRLVVTDQDGEQAWMVMDLDDYESLLMDSDLIEPITDEVNLGDFEPNEIDENFLFEDESATKPVVETKDEKSGPTNDLDTRISAGLSEKMPEKNDTGQEEQFYLEPVE